MKKILIIIVLFAVSCSKKAEEKKDVYAVMEGYSKAAIKDGDEFAYGGYLVRANNNNLYLGKLSLSLLMNHKHKNLRSYYLVYMNIIELYNNNHYKAAYLNNMDSIDVNYALYYLKQGAMKHDIDCQSTLESIYRNGYGIEQNSLKADSLYSILENDSLLGKFYRDNRNNKARVDRIN